MNVTETLAEGLKREYKVVIPAQDLAAKYSDKLAKLTQNVRLPGFRPGKVPPALLRKRYGDALASEVVEEAVSENASKALTDKGLRPAMQPTLLEVGKFEEGKDLEFRFAVEALPDIEPMEFRQLALERIKVGVEESAVDAALKRLAEGNPDMKPADAGRKAEKGDVAVIDFAGTIDGTAFPGGSAEILYDSIQRLCALPDELRAFTGHDYLPNGRALAFVATIGEHKRHNIQITQHTTRAEYVAFRNQRDAGLEAPQLILQALQVNIRAGELPEPEANGVSYLRIPLDVLGKR